MSRRALELARRACRQAASEAAAFGASATAAHACWAAALWPLGIWPGETAALAVPAAGFAAVFALEAAAAAAIPRFVRPIRMAGAVQTGFLVASAGTAAALHAVVERVTAPSNVGDMVLAGLTLGVPAGAACHMARQKVQKLVDTIWRNA